MKNISPPNFIDLTGKTFSHLIVIGRGGSTNQLQAKWECVCVCGKVTFVAGQKLRSGSTKSCGCMRGKSDKPITRNTKTYNSWLAMKQRCYYEKSEQYPNYGGRGITVCDRWRDSFENFIADMGERPSGTTIDRIDSNGNYEPSNCRWATHKEQSLNKRNTKRLTKDGITLTVTEWATRLGVKPDVIYGRLRWGRTVEEALK